MLLVSMKMFQLYVMEELELAYNALLSIQMKYY